MRRMVLKIDLFQPIYVAVGGNRVVDSHQYERNISICPSRNFEIAGFGVNQKRWLEKQNFVALCSMFNNCTG